MTRSSDVFISLDERVAIENSQKNAIFVSIHFNDSRRRAIHGFETYYHSGDSVDLARRIQSKLVTTARGSDRGVKSANFRVLRLAAYPAVLVECGFLRNRADGKQARDSDYRDLLADKIAEASVERRYGSGVYGASGSLAQTQCTGTTPHAPCTMNCMRNPPTMRSAVPGAKIQSGMSSIPQTAQITIERRRPQCC